MTGIGENTLAQPVKPPLRERRACLAKLVKNRLTLTEVAFRDDHEPNSNEHTVLGLEIINGLNDELVDAVARYHHSTLKSDDCPTDFSSDILRCVNIALVCNRLEELVYGPDPCPKKEALEAIRAETEEGYWPQEEAELLARLLSN